ncbi:MAG: DUF4349 domain-containing protein [Solirubrobacteraceae bacterium]
MRWFEEDPLDPEIGAALEVIEATLAGEAVDPRDADLAELALLLTAGRPTMDPGFAAKLDGRAASHFLAPGPSSIRLRARPQWPRGERPAQPQGRRHRIHWPELGGLLAALTAAFVAIVVLGGSGGRPSQPVKGTAVAVQSTFTRTPPTPSSAAGTVVATSSAASTRHPSLAAVPSAAAPSVSVPSAAARSAAAPSVAGQAILRPPANGRKIIQAAQLDLTTPPSRIDDVAQQVFDVVGAENGIVQSSRVTATGNPDGSADFQLSVPSQNLPETMAGLSRLRYATVASRTDTTQDVNSQYTGDQNQLADARALRTSLLRQLAGASTQTQIDSLNAQIHDAEASIAADQVTLGRLAHQISYSQIAVTIDAATPIPAPVTGSSGFNLGTAAHDARRVLTVAAGVALIALAVLVPVGLGAALVAWIALALARRRREQALDGA